MKTPNRVKMKLTRIVNYWLSITCNKFWYIFTRLAIFFNHHRILANLRLDKLLKEYDSWIAFYRAENARKQREIDQLTRELSPDKPDKSERSNKDYANVNKNRWN